MEQNRQAFYVEVQGNLFLLAGEIDKHIFLQEVKHAQKTFGWSLYAFCVTDDHAYFVICTNEPDHLEADFSQMTEWFLLRCTAGKYSEWKKELHMTVCPGKRIGSEQKILQTCRALHLLPRKLGYVEQERDYWWSSYITYLNIYDWEFLDTEFFFRFFSENEELAHRQIFQFHDRKPYIYRRI